MTFNPSLRVTASFALSFVPLLLTTLSFELGWAFKPVATVVLVLTTADEVPGNAVSFLANFLSLSRLREWLSA